MICARMIAAFDLDGTLANIEHRLHHIQGVPRNWAAFYQACRQDHPYPDVIAILKSLAREGAHIEIWTGRSDEVRTETTAWLGYHSIPYRELRMRKAGDHRQDHVVKAEWYDALPENERPTLFFDDRDQVVKMWRARGVRCLQVANGEF